ncbi:TipJ family phage tail tip protein [Methylobacterium nodulans]|uniref:Fibronectin type III domain protein n=1 Tax=Methylobacterium nodulans (strain LMG 21967 / CNCM I-2342 / ORS 2060) TaxID=460265 RepID=B8ISE2_METNO|nr:phage tail protein [Methylobacterium nodulans]ACL58782.1 Fibronectin type III domain protein [Methylobacterium nodulans ORS 2060]
MDSFERDPAAAVDDDARQDAPIRGRKSSSGRGKTGGSGSNAPDTLFSNATVRLVDLLGEGEITGVVGGLKGVYLNDVPVQNADGSFNFKGLSADFRTGTPDQSYMPGFPDVETPREVGVKVSKATPVTAAISDGEADRARVIIELPALFLAKNDGSVRQNSVSFRIEARYSGGPWVNQLGDLTITGKNTSPYFVSYEVALPRNPAGSSPPWQVRVTRLTDDTDGFNTSQDKWTSQSDLIFSSLTAIQDAKFSYPHSALVGLTADASNFGSSVPARTYLVDGLLIKVPSNYDPVARTYSGIWDGTFKEEWSDNPAWVFFDVLWNDRYGLGEFISVESIDKWTLYEIGRYCDVLVSDGKGGQEPRFRFNAQISTQQDAFDLLQQISAIWRGMAYWSSGAVTATQDRPDDVRQLVTPANVIDGLITYSSSGRKARHTVALVSWTDPDNLFKPQIEVVEHGEGIARYGYNPTKIDLLGCTSRGQAHREGLWRLLVENYATQTATYRAGLDHAVRRPGDIIAIADPQISNIDAGGRLKAGSTASTLLLDRPVTLKSGVPYEISVTLPDGSVAERQIKTLAGVDLTEVSVSPALPAVPDAAAVWQIAGEVVPQLFRIVGIKEVEPHIYEIQALQHEPSIYAAVDDGAAFEPLNISEFPNVVLAPTNLTVRESTYFENNLPRQSLLLSWTAGQPFNSVAYYVTAIKPNGSLVTLPKTSSTSVEFLDAATGEWTFIVQAEGLNGRLSDAVQTTYTVQGWEGLAGPTVTGLQVKGGGSVFTGRSCTLEWGLTWPADVRPYEVGYAFRVFDADTNALLHTEIITAAQATYDYEENLNEGGPRRRFRVSVAARDAIGRESQPAVLVVSNPPPGVVVPSATWTTESIAVQYTPPGDPDLRGALIWVSRTSGFNPLTTAPVYDGPNTLQFFTADPDTWYYVRVALYDDFGKNPAELNISGEVAVRTNDLIIDVQAPDIPTGLNLTTALEVSATGVATAAITAIWNPVGSSNLGIYEFELTEGDGITTPSWVQNRTNADQPLITWRNLKPGVLYTARVRSVNNSGVKPSGWSAMASIIAAKNTAKPGAITNFTVTAAFETANLRWTNPSDPDFAYTELWFGTLDDGSDRVLGTKVPAPLSFFTDTTLATVQTRKYWVRPVNSSGTPGDFVGPGTATTAALLAAQLQQGIIDATKFANGIEPVGIVSVLPVVAGYTGPKTVLLTTDGKLYRLVNGAWTAAVQAGDITGTLTSEQIQSLAATKIAGTLSDDQLAGISASKLVGQIVADQIENLDASQLTGQITDDQIAQLSAAKIAGTIAKEQIAQGAIDATKFATGLAAVENFATLPTTGNFDGRVVFLSTDKKLYRYDAAQGRFVSTVPAADITGTLTDAQINDLSAAKLSGSLPAAVVANISGLTGAQLAANAQISSDQIAGLAAAKLTTQITKTNIADNAVDTPQLNAGAVSTAKIAAGAVTTSRLAVASQNILFGSEFGQGLGMQGLTSGQSGGVVGLSVTINPASAWTINRSNALMIHASGAQPANAVVDVYFQQPLPNGTSQRYPVLAGQTYEWSAYLSTHRCAGAVHLAFYDAAGNWISSVASASLPSNSASGDQGLTEVSAPDPKAFPRASVIAVAPAGAASMLPIVRMDTTASPGTDVYVFASMPMLAAGRAGQTEPSPYVPSGVTVIDGGTVITNTLKASSIVAGDISARELGVDSVTAGAIKAGEIKAGKLAAGAVLASNLAVASLNLAANGGLQQGTSGWQCLAGGSGVTPITEGVRTDYAPAGMRVLSAHYDDSNKPTSGVSEIVYRNPDSTGTGQLIRVAGGATYEFSAYISAHRCTAYVSIIWWDANSNYITEVGGTAIVATQLGAGSSLADWNRLARSWVIATAPANAVFADIRVRWYNFGSQPYCMAGGLMFAQATAGQTEPSPYSDAGVTLIEGGNIRTLSIKADQIDTNAITAAKIKGGEITGDKLAANTIQTKNLLVSARPINTVGFNWRIDGKTGVITWDSGIIYYIDDNGNPTSASIAGSSFNARGAWYSINWQVGASNLYVSTDLNWALNREQAGDKSWICLVTFDNTYAGLDVHYGSTIIDGDRIVTGSINADRIVSKSITAAQIYGGTITAAELASNSVTTSKLAVASLNLAINGDMGNLNVAGNPAAWSIDTSQIAGATMLQSGVDYIYCPAGMRAMKIAATAVPTNQGSIGQVWLSRVETDGTLYPFSVRAGTTYEVSAYLSTHRCTAYVGLVWYDANQAYIGETWGSQIVNWQGSIYSPMADWEQFGRSKLIVVAPAGAVYCRPYVRYGVTWYPGQDVPYCFISGVMLAVAVAGQTEVSPFSPAGLTTINGASIRTGSIAADKIIAKSITAGQIATGTITATELNVANVRAGLIAAQKITGTEIDATTITAGNLAAGSVTGYKLAISTGNFAYNSEGTQSTRGWRSGGSSWGAALSIYVDSAWMPSGMTGIGCHPSDASGPAGQWFDLVHQTVDPATGASQRYAVQGGAWYEFSAYVNAHRCDIQCYIGWFDGAGNLLAYSSGQTIPQGAHTGGTIRDFPRFTWIGQAPGNAASCHVLYRGINIVLPDPYIFITGTMYAGANQNQTECSPYVPPAVTKIDGGSIVTNSLHANRITAGTLTAAMITADWLTAGSISTGAIKADQIAGGAISADKIGVGLNSTNLLYNTDFRAGVVGDNFTAGKTVPGIGSHFTNIGDLGSRAPYIGINQSSGTWQPIGMQSLQVSCVGTPPAGSLWDVAVSVPTQVGTWDSRMPVVGGKRYELTGYVSAHRSRAYMYVTWFDGAGTVIATSLTSVNDRVMSSGGLKDWTRIGCFATAPAAACLASVTLRMEFTGEDGPYTFWSGLYFGQAQPNQSTYSDWAPGSATVIWGDTIATGTMNANKITAGTITADKIFGGTITGDKIAGLTLTGAHIQSNSIYADKIQVGGGQSLTSWMGSDTTKINGGAIEANSIRVNALTVGLRGVRTVGLDFSVNKDTRVLSWTAGYVLWIDDSGNNVSSQVTAGSISTGGAFTYVWWNKFVPGQLNAGVNNWPDIFSDKNTILMCSYDGYAGLNPLYGGTIIDGTRINTGTITANQIAANAIQANHIAANQITASHIGVGALTADRIGTGMMTSADIRVGSDFFVLQSRPEGGWGRMFSRDNNGTLRVAVGYIGDLIGNSGGWGLAMWDAAGNPILNGTGVNGGGLWASSVSADKMSVTQLSAITANVGTMTAGVLQSGDGQMQVDLNNKRILIWG